jgi:hypothetical protein
MAMPAQDPVCPVPASAFAGPDEMDGSAAERQFVFGEQDVRPVVVVAAREDVLRREAPEPPTG